MNKKSIILQHAANWIILCLFFYLNNRFWSFASNWYLIIYVVLTVLSFAIVHYGVAYWALSMNFKKEWLISVIRVLSLLAIFTLYNKLVLVAFTQQFAAMENPWSAWEAIFRKSCGSFMLAFITGTGNYLNRLKISSAKLGIEKEKEILKHELKTLKDQFHSHLTFNFFNFCYSKLRKASPPAAVSIENFTEMLRYSLITKQNIKSPIVTEIEYLENYIAIQKCISSNTQIELVTHLSSDKAEIYPFILASWLDLFNMNNNSIQDQHQFHIELLVDDKKLIFEISSDKIKPNKNFENQISNHKALLNELYPHKFELIENHDDYGTSNTLIIQFD